MESHRISQFFRQLQRAVVLTVLLLCGFEVFEDGNFRLLYICGTKKIKKISLVTSMWLILSLVSLRKC